MADYLAVQRVACLDAIHNLAFQLSSGRRDDGYRLVEVGIERFFLGLNGLYPILFECAHKLRKDQLYFVDKSRKDGASTLYSISEFSTTTNENVRKSYLMGKYGATPDLMIEEVE